jgi:hypothetical protein
VMERKRLPGCDQYGGGQDVILSQLMPLMVRYSGRRIGIIDMCKYALPGRLAILYLVTTLELSRKAL